MKAYEKVDLKLHLLLPLALDGVKWRASLCRLLSHPQNSLPHQLNRRWDGLSSRSGFLGEKNFFLLPGIERRFLGCIPRGLVCWLRHAIFPSSPTKCPSLYEPFIVWSRTRQTISWSRNPSPFMEGECSLPNYKTPPLDLFHTRRMQSTFRHPTSSESIAHGKQWVTWKLLFFYAQISLHTYNTGVALCPLVRHMFFTSHTITPVDFVSPDNSPYGEE